MVLASTVLHLAQLYLQLVKPQHWTFSVERGRISTTDDRVHFLFLLPLKRTRRTPVMLLVLTQLNPAANESELYSYVMRSFQVFEKAIYGRVFEKSEACAHSGNAESDNEGNPQQSGLQPEDISDAMVWAWSNTSIVQFAPLEDVVDR